MEAERKSGLEQSVGQEVIRGVEQKVEVALGMNIDRSRLPLK